MGLEGPGEALPFSSLAGLQTPRTPLTGAPQTADEPGVVSHQFEGASPDPYS